ncbi:sushi, nidogen and EGF-like domain-containing protein 1 [Engraulis encrasicolus]|uniref:sushi, nidogen and EGF-like domain-containing protein 1 n=1 Tax=Engraulis encrasicolus TaxID=184585 RepID=UPI002FCFCC6A
MVTSLCLVLVAFGVCTNAQGAFYPFGSAAGDTFMPHSVNAQLINLTQPLRYFNQTHESINIAHGSLNFPDETYIETLYVYIDYTERGNMSYQQYTTGDVLNTATKDINSYFSNVTFTATWVFVVTWDRVVYYNRNDSLKNDQEATFQVVLVSDGDISFIFINYGVISQPPHPASIALSYEDGQIIIDNCFPNGTIDVINLNTSSNINVPGRWVIPASSELTFSCSYPLGLVPTPDLPMITPLPLAEHVVGMSLTVSSADRLNETEVEEQILPQFREALRQRGIDVTGIRLRRMIETQP